MTRIARESTPREPAQPGHARSADRAILAGLALLSLAHAGAILAGAPALPWWGSATNLALALTSAATAVLALRATSRAAHPSVSRAWFWIGSAFAAIATGELIRFGLSEAGIQSFPSAADAAYLLYYPLMLWALIKLPSTPGDRPGRMSLILDLVAIGIAGVMLVWFLILQPGSIPSGGSLLSLALALVYPLGDAALLIVYLLVWLRRPAGIGPRGRALLGASLVFSLASDVGLAALVTRGAYMQGGWIDWLWFPGKLCVAAACTLDRWEPSAGGQRDMGPLPYLVLVGGYLLLLATRSQLFEPIGGLIICAQALTVLLVARQVRAMRENVRLFEERAALAARAREAAEAASAAKSAFLATMSHELRTPLTAILGYSELLQLQAEQRGLSDFSADLAQIERSGQQLLHMVNNVLDLAKIESGTLPVTPQRFDLAAFIADTAIAAGPIAATHENMLQIECPPTIGEVTLDPLRLRQVIMHLLHNAGKFTQNGTITLRVARSADELVIEVADTGIGLDEQRIASLFQPFAQGQAGMARTYGGSGLGLTICQRLCALMGGWIDVASQPGAGATFSVHLPTETIAPSGQAATP